MWQLNNEAKAFHIHLVLKNAWLLNVMIDQSESIPEHCVINKIKQYICG